MGWKWTEAELAAYMATINGKKAHLAVVPKITEKQFQEQVRKAAIMNGWRYYHTFNSMRSTEGFPDCVMVHAAKKRLLIAELKSEDGKMTKPQAEWIADLAQVAGAEVFVWRPADMDQIWEILRR